MLMCIQIKCFQVVISNVITEIIKWGYRSEKNMPGSSPELLLLLETLFWFWYEHQWHVGLAQDTAGLVTEHFL